jgi:hypothetical protein
MENRAPYHLVPLAQPVATWLRERGFIAAWQRTKVLPAAML